MILDLESLFSDAQAITGSAVSTNVVQLGNGVDTPGDAGAGMAVPLLIQVVEDFDLLTDLTIDVQVDSTDAFGSPRVVTSANLLLADLVAGKKIPPQYIPLGADDHYMRLNYTVNGTNPANGAITAGVTMGVQTNG